MRSMSRAVSTVLKRAERVAVLLGAAVGDLLGQGERVVELGVGGRPRLGGDEPAP